MSRSSRCTGLRGDQLAFGSTRLDELVEQRQIGAAHLDLLASQPVDREIRCRLEQEGAQIAHRAGLIQAQQAHVGFLGHFARFVARAQSGVEKADQRFVVLAKQPLDDGSTRRGPLRGTRPSRFAPAMPTLVLRHSLSYQGSGYHP